MQSLAINDLLRVGDDARVLDIRLAEALEFERPRAIRQLIERNDVELEIHGPLPRHVAMVDRPQGGGRASTEYWLNEAQAILICMRSDAPRAAEVRAEIIAVFQAWRHGLLVPSVPSLNEIGHLFDTKLEPVHRGMAQMRDEIAEVKGNVVFLSKRVDDMAPRHDFTPNTRRMWVHVVWKFYNGMCPCCRKEKIVFDRIEIKGAAHADHFNGHERNTPQDGWLVGVGCNYRLAKDAQFKERAKPHFLVFQDNLLQMFGTATQQSSRKRSHSKTMRTKQQLDFFD
jgi:hypothetical protein